MELGSWEGSFTGNPPGPEIKGKPPASLGGHHPRVRCFLQPDLHPPNQLKVDAIQAVPRVPLCCLFHGSPWCIWISSLTIGSVAWVPPH